MLKLLIHQLVREGDVVAFVFALSVGARPSVATTGMQAMLGCYTFEEDL